jgi:hypothetical protein
VTLSRRQVRILLAAAAWTLYVWISRLVIMAGQDESAGFKVVHGVLALVSIGFAVAIAKIGLSARAAQQEPLPESLKDEPATGMNLKS